MQENWKFINLVYSTKCMELCYKYLQFKGVVKKSPAEFKQDFHDMWFKMYRRSRESRYCFPVTIFIVFPDIIKLMISPSS